MQKIRSGLDLCASEDRCPRALPLVVCRQSLLLSATVVSFVCAGVPSARAQSVTGSGDLTSGVSTPNWAVGGELRVGDTSTGMLNIADGGTVSSGAGSAAFVGNQAGSNGVVNVSGTDGSGNASTWTNDGDIVLGQNGTGTLNILNGGKVSNTSGYIGVDSTATATVAVAGSSADGLVSTWQNAGDLLVGDAGIGVLNITDGGLVSNAISSIGGQAGGQGLIAVSGSDGNGNFSTWISTGQIYIGNSGTGTLTVEGGGQVNSDQGLIGYDVGSSGTVTVTGTDGNGHASAWAAANNLYVGFSGSGALTIENGAAVATKGTGPGGNASVYIGYGVGSTGIVTLSSSTGDVSNLTVADSIDVGRQGDGVLSIEKGGFVSAGRDVYIGRFGTASGTLHLNGNVSGRGVLETGSVIKGAGPTTILDFNGGILRANRDEANFLNGFEALTVAAGGAWFDTNGHNITIGTDFSGSSSFNKLGLGQLTLTGGSAGFSGASTVSAGTLAVNGVLGGNMSVGTAGRLAGMGSVGNVMNTGVVAPGYGNAMGTLTVQGNYVSAGGRLEIATVLGDDSSQTSRLAVNGTTSGSTQVNIINRGGPGAQTVNGIKIVDVTGASNGSFVLNGNYVFQGAPAVIAGAYAYRLYQGGVSTPADGDWYLRSTLRDPGTPDGASNTPLYQPGVPVYEGYAANLQAINTLQTLQQRVGNRTWGSGAIDGNGIWGRTDGARGHFRNAARSTTGMDQNVNIGRVQVGVDRVLVDTDTSGRLIAGANVSYSQANSKINSVFGGGALNTNGYGLGATLTWYDNAGFYVDGQAQVNRYSSDLNSEFLGSLVRDNDGNGEAFSIEAGKRIAFNERLGITPQFQMIYSNVRFDRFVDPVGAEVVADKNDNLKTRLGVAIDHQGVWEGGRSRMYGIANVTYEWLDGMRARVAGVPINHADERLWGEFGIGASVTWRKKFTFYGELSASTPLRDFADSHIFMANAGLRAQF